MQIRSVHMLRGLDKSMQKHIEEILKDNITIIPGKSWLEILLLLLCDLASFGLTIVSTIVFRSLLFGIPFVDALDIQGVYTLQILCIFSLSMLTAFGLYPGRNLSAVMEMKQIIKALTLAYILTSMIIFIQRTGIDFSRSVFILSWFLIILILPVGRFMVRKFIARFSWWGEPVVVIGLQARIREVAIQLASCPRIGLRPAIGLAVDGPSREGKYVQILPWSKERQEQVQRTGIRTSILAIPPNDLRNNYPKVFRELELGFNKTVFILNADIFSFMMAQPMDIAGIPAILSKQSLLDPVTLHVKRLIDILFIAIFFIPILFVGTLLALLIRIESPGPILYTQNRAGRNRKIYRIYKFRTMVQNAEEVLVEMLKDPNVRDEWEQYHKLTDDRRITRVGALLRRLSLDELPQVINILRGEMSLVGPRPYVEEEIELMGDAAKIILHVPPGVTGWWQVSGRNKLSFQERIRLDLYYVSNWSLWLDLFIIIKTFWVLIFLRDGI